MIVLHKTAQEASVELNERFSNPQEAIAALVSLTESLPAQAREIWDRSESRTMNIGIQAGSAPYAASFAISRECIELLARIGGDTAITVYAPYDDPRTVTTE